VYVLRKFNFNLPDLFTPECVTSGKPLDLITAKFGLPVNNLVVYGLPVDKLVVYGLPNSYFLEGGQIVKKNWADDWQLHT